jgi:hypothetical protein
MIYTFHVGDYVRLERADGTSSKTLTGYVSSYQRPGRFHSFIFKWDDGTQTGWSGNIEDLPQNFTRIGKYDFAWIRAVRDCGYAEKVGSRCALSAYTAKARRAGQARSSRFLSP